ncbi:MAG: hypothetical protein JW938_01465 [Candidatus Omnitrophica bacterium]|nr:hypothetical protein [Candidatus Omnitrophota bacterium]
MKQCRMVSILLMLCVSMPVCATAGHECALYSISSWISQKHNARSCPLGSFVAALSRTVVPSLSADETIRSYLKFKKLWNRTEPRTYQTKYNINHIGDTFASHVTEANTFLKPFIKTDIEKARVQGNRSLVYVVSGGQRTDIEWLIDTIAGLIEGDHERWDLALIVINDDSGSLKTARRTIKQLSRKLMPRNISLFSCMLEMSFFDLSRSARLARLIGETQLPINGIMHNLGIYAGYYGNHRLEYERYFSALKTGLLPHGWCELDRMTYSKKAALEGNARHNEYMALLLSCGFKRHRIPAQKIEIFSNTRHTSSFTEHTYFRSA